jgi:RimJ/RimL family protein N-acetyltransferase
MDDLDAMHQILDVELRLIDVNDQLVHTFEERKKWLQWSIMNYEQLEKLLQPPYGDRAVVLKRGHWLIGTCGFVPCLEPFEYLPFSPCPTDAAETRYNSAEVGLFYAFSRAYQGQGYATEATKAMIAYAFKVLKLRRIVATTTHDNARSIGVMQRVGMAIEKNPKPGWPQVIGILENRSNSSIKPGNCRA